MFSSVTVSNPITTTKSENHLTLGFRCYVCLLLHLMKFGQFENEIQKKRLGKSLGRELVIFNKAL